MGREGRGGKGGEGRAGEVVSFIMEPGHHMFTVKLAHKVCQRLTCEPITDSNQFSKALKQLLPMA